jgi:hypothetical protein
MGYYDEWESGMYNDYVEPTADQINDWNIHNDHQGDNEDAFDLVVVCDWCDNEIKNTSNSDGLCQECQDEYDRANPHPLNIAEREDREAENFGLKWESE